MKHLTTYKLFESFRYESIKNDIMDMSLDIQDEGFRVSIPEVSWIVREGDTDFIITIDKFRGFRNHFDIEDIRDFLLRVTEYGRTSPCEIKIYVHQRNHTNQRDLVDIRTLESERILDYRVTFVEIHVRPFS